MRAIGRSEEETLKSALRCAARSTLERIDLMRSRIPQIQIRAKEIIAELRKSKDVLDLVLDEFAPLAEGGEAQPESATSTVKQTCKFALPNGKVCGAAENDPIHGPEQFQHKFQVRKSRAKKVLPDDVKHNVAADVKKAQEIQPGACVQCPNAADANIHHLSSTPGFHEFKEAA